MCFISKPQIEKDLLQGGFCGALGGPQLYSPLSLGVCSSGAGFGGTACELPEGLLVVMSSAHVFLGPCVWTGGGSVGLLPAALSQGCAVPVTP